MSKLIVSVFPDCGKYNPLQLSCTNVFIPPGKYRKLNRNKSFFGWNPEFPKNYIDVVKKSQDKFDVILVSSAPNVRYPLVKEFKENLVVVYFKDDPATLDKFLATIDRLSDRTDEVYRESVKNNWQRWHVEAKLFCVENDVPYYEVDSTEDMKALIEKLVAERN